MTGEGNADRRSDTQSDSSAADRAGAANQGACALTAAAIVAAVARARNAAASGAGQDTGKGAGITKLPVIIPIGWRKFTYDEVKHDGVIAGEIIGWRCWLLSRPHEAFLPHLQSVMFAIDWEPGKPLYGGEDFQKLGGVHAWKTNAQAVAYAKCQDGFLVPVIVGRVKLWGEVIEHVDGYRAEWAKPLSLDQILFSSTRPRTLPDLRKRYGV